MSLIKRYTTRRIIVEMLKFKDGYHVSEKEWCYKTDKFQEVFRHTKIQALNIASNLAAERARDAEVRQGTYAKVYMNYGGDKRKDYKYR